MGQISVKLKDTDEAKLKKAAQAERKTLAQYCREILTNQTEAAPIEHEPIEEEIAALRAEIIHQNELTRALFKVILYDEKKTMVFVKEMIAGAGAKAEQIAAAEEIATTEANAFLRDLGR